MNINAVNSSVSFGNKSNLEIKYFSTKLFDGNIAKIRVRHEGNRINTLECYTFNQDDRTIAGKAFGRNPFLKLVDVSKFLSDVQEHTNDNVFQKFTEAVFKS